MTVGPRIAMISAVLTLVVGGLGLIITLALGAFVFDDYDAYGEVPVPGTGRVGLPAGEVTISFHTAVTGGVNGGFPVPPLKLGIDPPEGVPDPVISETTGTTTSVNNDVHVRIWVVQIPRAGVYDVRAGGDVGGYDQPAPVVRPGQLAGVAPVGVRRADRPGGGRVGGRDRGGAVGSAGTPDTRTGDPRRTELAGAGAAAGAQLSARR